MNQQPSILAKIVAAIGATILCVITLFLFGLLDYWLIKIDSWFGALSIIGTIFYMLTIHVSWGWFQEKMMLLFKFKAEWYWVGWWGTDYRWVKKP